jgi:hypothetical protein
MSEMVRPIIFIVLVLLTFSCEKRDNLNYDAFNSNHLNQLDSIRFDFSANRIMDSNQTLLARVCAAGSGLQPGPASVGF